MARCQYCKKLTHSEKLKVYFELKDMDKVQELFELSDFTPAYMYDHISPEEMGKLKCGDILLHFQAILKKI